MSLSRLSRLRPRTAGFFAFRAKPGQERLLRAAAAAFRNVGWKVLTVQSLARALGRGTPVVGEGELARRCSLLVSLGGDGTLLGAAVLGAPLGRPVLGVNLGGLGYITAFGPVDLDSKIEAILKQECRVETRRMALAEVFRKGVRILRLDALNDVVLARLQVGRISHLRAHVDGEFLAEFRADGLIFSTPTGSTAYNLSVGGPLVDPASPVLILSLISPHALSHRPLVLPDDRVLEVVPSGDMELAVDGRRPFRIKAGDTVRLGRSPFTAKLVSTPAHDPWAVLRDKLGWQGSPGRAVLERLDVQNLALIESLSLEPGPGLNLVTGETGSGKSLVLDALGFVVGARASADLVRAQADSVQVSAVFVPPKEWTQRWRPWFEEKGLPWEEGQLLLKRELRRDGKGRAWINASAAPVGLLAELGQGLVDFHGQHDHQSLLRVPEHRETLDRFAGDGAELEKVAEAFDAVQAARKALEGPAGGPEARQRQLEFLEFQARELEELSPKEGEWTGLKETCDLQASAGRRAEVLGAVHASLNSDDQGALAGLRQAFTALKRLPETDPSRRDYERRMETVLLELRDVAEGLGSVLESVELDPAVLERLQSRLHTWEALARKQRCAPEELTAVWKRLAAERDSLKNSALDEAGLQKELKLRERDYVAAATMLGLVREKAAVRLIKALTTELRELIGAGALFTVRLSRREGPVGAFVVDGKPCLGDRHGIDDVEFLFAANPGEQPKALAKIASGGELSRVALGLKTVFSRQEGAPCLVFDEIDAGISGRVAALVGERIAALAGRHQVFCITHLPQIASLPGRHFKVSKRGAQGRTVTAVEPLDAAGREAELAALLGGGESGASALAHARQLLARAAESVG